MKQHTCKCKTCGRELICAHCVGTEGIRKAQREHGIKAFREWGKKGGRPRKNPDNTTNKPEDTGVTPKDTTKGTQVINRKIVNS